MSESKVEILNEEENSKATETGKKTGKPKKHIFLKVLAYVAVTLAAICYTLYLAMAIICNGPSQSAKQLFVTTILETGEMKFLASWYLSEDEIQALVDDNSMEPIDRDVDVSLIKINKSSVSTSGGSVDESDKTTEDQGEPIEVINISGRTYQATLMIVKDPSRVSLQTVYSATSGWPEYGKVLGDLVTEAGGVAGINGGLYNQWGVNKGGVPNGVVVCNGEIQMNKPTELTGLYLIGLTNDNILVIKSLSGMSTTDVVNYVNDNGVRDACCFQEESSDTNNHFVQLVINGEARDLNGAGSGLNPRTAIGQRADGAILFLVTDGRGYNSHLGASASDLVSIMMEYGAVNAANLDGGSSSCMYYNGEYLKTSVTFKYSNSSWYLPLAFVVK